MALSPIGTEFMVPLRENVAERIEDFYRELGWNVLQPEGLSQYRVVQLALNGIALSLDGSPSGVPHVSYHLTESMAAIGQFTVDYDPTPSEYSQGWCLRERADLHRTNLYTSSGHEVGELRQAGGRTLLAHIYEDSFHVTGDAFCFEDPFGYVLRVTVHPQLVLSD